MRGWNLLIGHGFAAQATYAVENELLVDDGIILHHNELSSNWAEFAGLKALKNRVNSPIVPRRYRPKGKRIFR